MKRLLVAKYGYIVMSIIFYLCGLTYMFLPELSPLAVCVMSGICLLAYGAIKLVGYLSPDPYQLAFQYDMASAILLMIVGVLVLVCNTRIFEFLIPGLGILLLFDSALTIQTAKDAAKFGIRNWYLLLIVSIIAAVFGILMIIGPFPNMRAKHVIVGLAVISEGIMKHFVVGCTLKKREKKHI